MPEKRIDHIVTYDGSDGIHKPMETACLRCGHSYTLMLPVGVDEFVTLGKAFIAQHRKCEPEETGAPDA